MSILSPGDVDGHSSLLSKREYGCHVLTTEEVKVCNISILFARGGALVNGRGVDRMAISAFCLKGMHPTL